MELYTQLNEGIGRTFDLDVATAEYIWICIKHLEDASHIKNEVRALVIEAQKDFDKQVEF